MQKYDYIKVTFVALDDQDNPIHVEEYGIVQDFIHGRVRIADECDENGNATRESQLFEFDMSQAKSVEILEKEEYYQHGFIDEDLDLDFEDECEELEPDPDEFDDDDDDDEE